MNRDLALDSRDRLAAVNIELFVYKLVLCGIVLPVFGIAAPLFFLQQAVVEAYRFLRRLVFVVAGAELPQVERIRFEGNAFYEAALLVVLALMVVFAVRYRRAMRSAPHQRILPDAPNVRRFRALPASVSSAIQARIAELWLRVGTGTAPEVLCFASTGLAACVAQCEARPAVAISTGMMERDASLRDGLCEAILLHELSHVAGRDSGLFRRATAFVEAFRSTFIVFIVAMALVFVLSAIGEICDFGGIEKRSPSIAAFVTGSVRELLFPYAGMVLVLRYVALIIMLTELRADLRAALALGDIAAYAATIRDAQGLKQSSRTHLVRSWIGTKVSHLTAQERIDVLQRPGRLLTPRYRYFAASIALSIFLIIEGAIAFSGFDWVVQTGVIATVAALNAITVGMATALSWDGPILASVPRLVSSALVVVAGNMLFLFKPSEVMGTTDELIIAYTDPNFVYQGVSLLQAHDAWYAAVCQPAAEAVADGRLLGWVASVLAALLLLRATPPGTARRAATVGSGLAAALATVVVAAGAPFATYMLLPRLLSDARGPIAAAMVLWGTPAPIMAGAMIGFAMIVGAAVQFRRSRRRLAG